jgi:flagellar biosynthesis protein FliQ
VSQADVLYLFSDALYLIMLGVAVLIVPSLLVGLVVSVFQAATQINEQTLSFLPRLLATLATVMALGPWLLSQLADAFQEIMAAMPGLIG